MVPKEDTTGRSVVRNGVFAFPNGVVALSGVSFAAVAGEMVGVVGSVGSGKSSLLAALLGELELMSGSAELRGSVALCSQQAWLTSGTVKENILFMRPYDEDKYKWAVAACCLLPDFEQLPDGDLTMVGER